MNTTTGKTEKPPGFWRKFWRALIGWAGPPPEPEKGTFVPPKEAAGYQAPLEEPKAEEKKMAA